MRNQKFDLLLAIVFFFSIFMFTYIAFSAEPKKVQPPNISNQESSQPLPTKPHTIPTPQRKSEDKNIDFQDIPVIKSFIMRLEGAFSMENQALAGEKPSLVFTWDVEAGVGGSSISSIVVEKLEGPGPEVNFRTSDSKGSRALNPAAPLSPGKTNYKITATNLKGRSASSTAFIEVFSFRQALEKVQLTNIAMPETEMGKTFDLSLTFTNTNKFGISYQIIIHAFDGHTVTPIALRNSENTYGNWTIYLGPSSSKEIKIPCILPLRDERHYWKGIKIIIAKAGETGSLITWEYPLSLQIKKVFRLTR